MRKVVKFSCLALVLAGLGLAGYIWLALSFAYSEGERAGFVQKFSRRGWLCKTWEGELAMANLPGTMPEVFTFTVHDDEVATRLNAEVGNRVVITYEQHLGIPTSCFGETSYFVIDVRRAE